MTPKSKPASGGFGTSASTTPLGAAQQQRQRQHQTGEKKSAEHKGFGFGARTTSGRGFGSGIGSSSTGKSAFGGKPAVGGFRQTPAAAPSTTPSITTGDNLGEQKHAFGGFSSQTLTPATTISRQTIFSYSHPWIRAEIQSAHYNIY